VLFGDDVAVQGGVYWVTMGLRSGFGAARVRLALDEVQSSLYHGWAWGLGPAFPAYVQIHYLAYLHTTPLPLRREAARWLFFSQGQ